MKNEINQEMLDKLLGGMKPQIMQIIAGKDLSKIDPIELLKEARSDLDNVIKVVENGKDNRNNSGS